MEWFLIDKLDDDSKPRFSTNWNSLTAQKSPQLYLWLFFDFFQGIAPSLDFQWIKLNLRKPRVLLTRKKERWQTLDHKYETNAVVEVIVICNQQKDWKFMTIKSNQWKINQTTINKWHITHLSKETQLYRTHNSKNNIWIPFNS